MEDETASVLFAEIVKFLENLPDGVGPGARYPEFREAGHSEENSRKGRERDSFPSLRHPFPD